MRESLIEFKRAPLAERFGPGSGRRIFYATDENAAYWDDGTAWHPFASAPFFTLDAAEYIPPLSAVTAAGARAVAGDTVAGF